MIVDYLKAAMRKAKYERIPGEKSYFGKIPGFKGLWASGPTKKACELVLRERLEEWLLMSLRLNASLPVAEGFSLNRKPSSFEAELTHA
ncbi:MAG: type II toxin-antitoxin system HicB family antitoxin [Planctomycetota bacterium]